MARRYSIRDIETVEHPDGRIENIACDESLKLILAGLDKMGLTLPIADDQWEKVEEYLDGLDAEIGMNETDGVRATREYDDCVGRAVDEFLLCNDADFLDYVSINRRLIDMMGKCGKDGVFELDYPRWKSGKQPEGIDHSNDIVRIKLRYGCDTTVPYTVSVNFITGQCRYRTSSEGGFIYSKLGKRQLGTVTKQLRRSGLLEGNIRPEMVYGGHEGELTVVFGCGKRTVRWTSGNEGIDDRFAGTLERYLSIVPEPLFGR